MFSLGNGLGWAEGITCWMAGVQIPAWEEAILGERGAHYKV